MLREASRRGLVPHGKSRIAGLRGIQIRNPEMAGYALLVLRSGRVIDACSAKKKKKIFGHGYKKKEEKKIKNPLLKAFIFYHIHFKVKENGPRADSR